MKPHGLKAALSELPKSAAYRTSPLVIIVLCAIAAAAINILAIMRWPALKDAAALLQFAIFAGSALALCGVAFFVIRRVEARAAERRKARGEPPKVATTALGTWIFATLLFGGSGVFVLWASLTGGDPIEGRALGAGLVGLTIGLACARMVWARIRQR